MTYHYCLNCGIMFNEPQIYKSCNECNREFKSGKQYSHCKRCGCVKDLSKYGLCLPCYNQVRNLESKASTKY